MKKHTHTDLKINFHSGFFTFLTFLLLFVVTGCGDGASSSSAEDEKKVSASAANIEKPQLTFGFIKLTDMAPLAIAKELGYFEEEGLYVTLEAQSNWKNVLDRVIDGQIDGSHMLAWSADSSGPVLEDRLNSLRLFQWI